MRDFVGPIPVPDSVFEKREDPVWTAVYEHVLLNSSTYVLQASQPGGNIVWRSDNLLADSLPRLTWFTDRGMQPWPTDSSLQTTPFVVRGIEW